MPELPEVETVRRVLKDELIDTKIMDVDIRYSPIIEGDDEKFKKSVIGKTIKDINRLGKFLIFNMNEGNIISHLRMEGKYYYLPKKEESDKHIHVIYYLDNGYMLEYKDVRKFGRMEYKENEELYITKPLCQVGYEPLKLDDCPYDDILKKINRSKLAIKTILLDQSIIAGLGNIYVDEVLYMSHLNPFKEGSSIKIDELKTILNSACKILNKAIEYKGTTIRSYTSSLGVIGGYQDFLLVHTKDICPYCKEKLEKKKINGRSTYYCIKCQR